MTSKHRPLLKMALLAVAAGLALVLVFQWRALPPVTPQTEAPEAPGPYTQDPIEPLPEFAGAEIGLSRAEICTTDDGDSAATTQSYDESPARMEEFEDLLRNVKDRLAVSTTAEHLHLAALLEDDPAVRIGLIKNAVSRSPNDAYLLWDAVRICADELDKTDCPIHQWEDRLLAIDGQNSESWIRVAANRYSAGDADGALRAMRQAATSAETRAYWTEAIEMIERGFAAGSDYSFTERAGATFGIAAWKQPAYGDYLNMCRDRSAKNTDWAYVCLAYGELVEKQGKTDMGQSVALSMQKLALEAIGDEDKLAAVRERQEASRQEMLAPASSSDLLAEKLMLSNPAIFSAYLAAVRTHGEASARSYLREEGDHWLSQQPDLDCDP